MRSLVGRAASLGAVLLGALLAAPTPCAPARGQEQVPQTQPADRRVDLDLLRYYTGEQLQAALESLGSAYPELLRVESMGKSRGGRELWVVTLAARDGTDPATRGAVLVVGGLGEAQSVEMALFTLYDLALNHARDPAVADVLRSATLYFVPCLDPDGRAALFEPPSDAAPAPRPVVLDRNFPAGWSPWQEGAGAYPLSEPETRALADFLQAHPNVAIVQTCAEAAPPSPTEGQPGFDLEIPDADVELHEAVARFAAGQLEEPDLLVSAAAARPRGGSLLAHVVGERGALGFTSLVGGRAPGRLPQVQELFALARRAGSHTLLLARALPRLEIGTPSVTRLRNELWQVDVQVGNTGVAATAGSLARTRRLVALPRFEVGGGKVVAVAVASPQGGGLRPLPQPAASFALPDVPAGARVQLRLVVAAPAETELTLTASAPRAGQAAGTATLR